MAYTAGGLSQLNAVNGFGLYRYDSLDTVDEVGAAGYFNNLDDDLRLAIGDIIMAFDWATAVGVGGTLSGAKSYVVTNVIANDAASSAGAVNCAEIWTSAPTISSVA